MDDIDDLDNALFGSLSKSKTSKAPISDKKKVEFQGIDEDDPFGDLLSDTEDLVDYQKKVPAKSDHLSSLFGIKTESSKEQEPNNLETKKRPVIDAADNKGSNSSPQRTVPKSKSIFDDKDDIISNLTDKKPSTSNAKKSLMEDLFGNRPRTSPVPEATQKKSTPNFTVENPTPEKSSSVIGYSPTASAPKEPRRSRRASPMLNDPLGILPSSNLEDPKPPEDKPKSKSSTDLPDWLGGSKTTAKEDDKPAPVPVVPTPSVDSIDHSQMSKLLGAEFDQQSAIMTMQQQEHELRTAASLSLQSEKLSYLLENQRSRLSEQEKQFNVLISRQIERQSMLEAQMKSQQDRIDSYIQTLAAQPTSVPAVLFSGKGTVIGDKIGKEPESESLVQKLQLEKVYLENTIDCLREKHEKEITIIDESYRKQVAILEEAMVQLDKRMQDEIECLEADYKAKVQKLKEELSENDRIHKEEKEAMKEENWKSLQEISVRHANIISLLQKEHALFIENINKSKALENEAIDKVTPKRTKIDDMLKNSRNIAEELEILRKKFQDRDESYMDSKEAQLKTKEQQLEQMKNKLEVEKVAMEEERQRLAETMKKLDSTTIELTAELQRKNSSFHDSEELLKMKERQLAKDRELFVEQMKWERDRLQEIKDSWSKEEERQLNLLAQERQALATERGQLQIVNRMKTGADDALKIELESAINAAQEATMNANRERQRWQEKMKELEIQRSTFQEKENRLVIRAKELQDLTQSTLLKREEGLKALKEARFIEERYKEKFGQLQRQYDILAHRESQLANDKIEFARERLTLRIGEVEKPERDGKNDIVNSLVDDRSCLSENKYSSQYITHFKDVVDPRLLLLKLDLDDKMEFID